MRAFIITPIYILCFTSMYGQSFLPSVHWKDSLHMLPTPLLRQPINKFYLQTTGGFIAGNSGLFPVATHVAFKQKKTLISIGMERLGYTGVLSASLFHSPHRSRSKLFITLARESLFETEKFIPSKWMVNAGVMANVTENIRYISGWELHYRAGETSSNFNVISQQTVTLRFSPVVLAGLQLYLLSRDIAYTNIIFGAYLHQKIRTLLLIDLLSGRIGVNFIFDSDRLSVQFQYGRQSAFGNDLSCTLGYSF